MSQPGSHSRESDRSPAEAGLLARMAIAMTGWTERWVPDAFIFALLATVIVIVAGVLFTPSSLPQVIDAWGTGFWELIPFTLQMSLIIITGYVLATSQPVWRVIRVLAAWPTSPRHAVAFVAFFAMTSSWFNWGFSLIFSAVLAREIARRVEGVDYRALAAASFLGLGSIWAQGLSGSAALQMATPGALQPQIREIVAHGGLVADGIISFRHTIFLWQSLTSVVIEIIVVTAVMWLVTPPAGRARTARDLGIALGKSEIEPPPTVANPTPGQWLEHSPILNWLIVLVGGTYLVRYFMQAGEPLSAITLNIVNLTFLLLGFLLHQTPARLMHAVQGATPAVWGVILQFPFYAGIAGIITSTHLSQQIAHTFVSLSTPRTFPAIVATYSAVLGVFVPSGGSKWVVEAPYVMAAAHELKVHLGWVVASYDLGEALANLVQPFWMLPILGLFQLRARDVMGYTFIVFLVLVPVVLVLVTLLGATLSYPL
ncbi:MAG: TIGR00366 family protein [Verrucomicrobiota bacterium]|nr:short-chain fatty acid transporter [Chthoniobacterales bacterium]MDQ3413863.1 TIGR00366 family protein [Verrucomicrobiota bacterium]